MSVSAQPLRHPLREKYDAAQGDSYKDGTVVTRPGGLVMPRHFTLDAQRILDMTVRQDDVWVISFPKSGTTWTQEMIWLLMNDLDFKTAKNICITKRFPFLEHRGIWPMVCRELMPDTIQIVEEQPSPRFIKSHLCPTLLPKQIWSVKPKIIYVARNPKDAATSYYYHNCLLYGLTLSLDEFLEAFLENVVHCTPYWGNVLEFWKLRHEPNILWNTYEDMKQDLPAMIRKTASFLGKRVTDEQVRLLEDHLSFTSMRDNPGTNYTGLVQQVRTALGLSPAPADLSFLRQGRVGDGQRRMSEDMQRRFDRWIQDNISGTGYDGPIS